MCFVLIKSRLIQVVPISAITNLKIIQTTNQLSAFHYLGHENLLFFNRNHWSVFCFIQIILLFKDNGHYHFEYGVHDPHTGDIKTHYETRHGKYVYGEYTLVEPDGTKRIVKYRVGPHTGFEAIVERVGHAHHGHDGSSYVETTHWGNQGHNQHSGW